jgi:putative acetyltransferase
MSTISFRPYLAKDAEALADLFVTSIEELAEDYYDAHAALRDDPKLKENRIIEMLYVAPDHAGQGIGKALLDVMELLARQRGAETLTTDASEAAREFFEKRGYEMQARNTVMRADEWLVNTTMKKRLPPAAPTANA